MLANFWQRTFPDAQEHYSGLSNIMFDETVHKHKFCPGFAKN